MEVEMIWASCSACGVLFGMTKSYETTLRSSHATFHCPNGHQQHWADPTAREKELQALKNELQATKEELARVNKKLAALDAYYGQRENRLMVDDKVSIALVMKEVET